MAARNPLVLVAGAISELPTGDTIIGVTEGAGGAGGSYVIRYSIVGALTAGTGTMRWYPDADITISSVYFSLGTAGTATIDILKNGTSIFSGAKPTVTAGNKSSVVAVSVAVATTDYLTVAVLSAGGSDATVCVVYSSGAGGSTGSTGSTGPSPTALAIIFGS